MKVLVSGSDGYIGIDVVNQLIRSGHEVYGIDLQYFGSADKHFVNPIPRLGSDILDVEEYQLKGFEHIIHLAAISNDPAAELSSKITWETNVLGTLSLIDNAVRAGVPQFTFASSGSVYGLKDELKVTEDLKPTPLTDYNKSKMCAERIVQSYCDDIGTTIVRPATVCGVSRRQRLDVVVNILTYQALKHGSINLFGGHQIRPHIHIKDMVRLYDSIVTDPKNFQGTFNAGFEDLTNKKLAEHISELTSASINQSESPDNRSYRLCSDKLISAGFSPKYTVKDAIEEFTTAFRDGQLQDGPETNSVSWLKSKLN